MIRQNPFAVSDKYENSKMKSRIQARIQKAEKARENLTKIEEKISEKDKYITNRYKEPCTLPGYVSNKTGMEKVVEKTLKRKANKNIILGLSSLLVWFVALFFYVIFSSLGFEEGALGFLYAIPATAIVVLSLRSAWHDFRWNKSCISVIVWGCLLSIHITLWVLCNINLWRIYLLGIPGQAAIFLWFRMFRPVKEERNDG
jgi:hypothetical protein